MSRIQTFENSLQLGKVKLPKLVLEVETSKILWRIRTLFFMIWRQDDLSTKLGTSKSLLIETIQFLRQENF